MELFTKMVVSSSTLNANKYKVKVNENGFFVI